MADATLATTDSDADLDLPASERHARRIAKVTPWVLIVGGVIGIIASFVLTMEKLAILADPNYQPSCDINPVFSCGSVIVTKQAALFGFPNPFIGLTGFAVVVTLGVVLASGVTLPRWIWLGLNAGAVFGLLFISWLVSQSLYVIGALCPWCMVVWTVTIPIFVYVTVANLVSGRLRTPASWAGAIDIVGMLRNWIIVGLYLVIAALIFVRWFDFWLGRM